MDSKGLTSKTRSNTMTSIHIGHDISLIEEGVDEDSARVYVEANNGEVSITCAWGDAWAGYKVVR